MQATISTHFRFRDSPCIVVNVEYRLAPEHKFPANSDDAKCVVEWMAQNKPNVGKNAILLALSFDDSIRLNIDLISGINRFVIEVSFILTITDKT